MTKTLLLVAWLLFALASPAAAADVSFDRAAVAMSVGERVTLSSKIGNPGAEPSGQILAHLNVVSLTDSVYVDPEDWSSERTLQVPPLPAGASTTLSWELQAVNAGSFAVYVVVLPDGSASTGADAPVVSPLLHVEVAGRRTLNAEGALPVVLGVPIVLGLLAVGARRRLRRTS
jgi:hypothetical protein